MASSYPTITALAPCSFSFTGKYRYCLQPLSVLYMSTSSLLIHTPEYFNQASVSISLQVLLSTRPLPFLKGIHIYLRIKFKIFQMAYDHFPAFPPPTPFSTYTPLCCPLPSQHTGHSHPTELLSFPRRMFIYL